MFTHIIFQFNNSICMFKLKASTITSTKRLVDAQPTNIFSVPQSLSFSLSLFACARCRWKWRQINIQNDVDVAQFSQKIGSVKWTHHQNDRKFNSCFRTSSKASEHKLCALRILNWCEIFFSIFLLLLLLLFLACFLFFSVARKNRLFFQFYSVASVHVPIIMVGNRTICMILVCWWWWKVE